MAEILSVKGQNIALRRTGAGPCVILLHCSSSHSGQWRDLIKALEDDYCVLAPDLHGYGNSDPLPHDQNPFFIHDTEIVLKLLENREGVHLVGHSLGGIIALHAALRAPEKIASLTLIEPVHFSFLEEMNRSEILECFHISTTVQTLVRFGRREEAAREFVNFWAGPGSFDEMDEKNRDYVIGCVDRVAADWLGISASAPKQVRLVDTKLLDMPCQLICGDQTRKSARAVIDLLANSIGGATLNLIPGGRHLAAATQPGKVNPGIVEFINNVQNHAAGSGAKGSANMQKET